MRITLAFPEASVLAGGEAPVVDEAAAAEGAGKVPHLLWRRIEPVPVGPLRLCAHFFPPFLGLDVRKLLEQTYYIGQGMSSGAP